MYTDELYLSRCLELAAKALGNVAPNPLVGSVIVYENRIVGEGYHQEYGKAHAEVNAINQVLTNFSDASEMLAKSTLYVNLEPCSHTGKTPPCSELIIKHRIPKVITGSIDPFASVKGKGIEQLKAAGVEVLSGILEKESDELNKRFFTFHQQQRPYIILKWAESTDGFLAKKEAQRIQISAESAQRLVHKWRAEEQAVLVGTRTASIDNPQLNIRLWQGENPLRVVIDMNLKLSKNLHLFDKRIPTLIINSLKTETDGLCTYIQVDSDNLLVPQILYQLYLMDIQSLIVEGGAKTLDSFIRLGLWDEARVFTSTKVKLNEGISAPALASDYRIHTETIAEDLLSIYRKK